ncbi:hypothetical protein FA13DRAFT_1732123 [Coprinellus micaceus]|uniref:Uncharacterized protein n=1 Tax=Coprinellus micaceus TaxID=71717 RepID=A0A4Y7TCB7_COPMI|nr:hypothetical protein FA13DRAFT_1732123 [Coprinellus micaceus]
MTTQLPHPLLGFSFAVWPFTHAPPLNESVYSGRWSTAAHGVGLVLIFLLLLLRGAWSSWATDPTGCGVSGHGLGNGTTRAVLCVCVPGRAIYRPPSKFVLDPQLHSWHCRVLSMLHPILRPRRDTRHASSNGSRPHRLLIPWPPKYNSTFRLIITFVSLPAICNIVDLLKMQGAPPFLT